MLVTTRRLLHPTDVAWNHWALWQLQASLVASSISISINVDAWEQNYIEEILFRVRDNRGLDRERRPQTAFLGRMAEIDCLPADAEMISPTLKRSDRCYFLKIILFLLIYLRDCCARCKMPRDPLIGLVGKVWDPFTPHTRRRWSKWGACSHPAENRPH